METKMEKRVPRDKKIILSIASYLMKLFEDYEPKQEFLYDILLDKKNKTIGLKIMRCKEVKKK